MTTSSLRVFAALLMLALALFAGTVAGQVACTATGQLDPSGDYCNCYSTYTTADCSTQGSLGACSVTNSAPYVQAGVATLTDIEFTSGNLEASVAVPFMNQRINQISLSNVAGTVASADCGFPGPHWTQAPEAGSCSDVYTGSLAWTFVHDNCGLTRTEDAAYIYYSGVINVLTTDNFQNEQVSRDFLNGQRNTTTTFPFQFYFPKEATVNSTVSYRTQPYMSLALSQVAVDTTARSGAITVTVYGLAPFAVGAPLEVTSVNRPDVSIGLTASSDCTSATATQDCVQTFTARLTPDVAACDLTGQYQFVFPLICRDQPGNVCPGAINITATVSIATTDICGAVSINANLTATAGTADPAVPLTPKTTFNQWDWCRIETAITSDSGTAFTSLAVKRIAVTGSFSSDSLVVLYEPSSTTENVNAQIDVGSPSGSFDSIGYDSRLSPLIYGRADTTITFVTTLTVGFAGTTKKRDIDIITQATAPQQQQQLSLWRRAQGHVAAGTSALSPRTTVGYKAEAAGVGAPDSPAGGRAGGVSFLVAAFQLLAGALLLF